MTSDYWQERLTAQLVAMPVRRSTGNNVVATISVIIIFFFFPHAFFSPVVYFCHTFSTFPRRPFWGPLAAILDFAGSAALQAVSGCPWRRYAYILFLQPEEVLSR